MSDPDGNDVQQHGALDPLHGLAICFADLLPGDILLFRSIDQKRVEQRISQATGSPYTHAAVYLGDNEILEAGDPQVETRQLSEADKDGYIIGVIRTQAVFSAQRTSSLKAFAAELIKNNAEYDWKGIFKFKAVRTALEEELQEMLEKYYGQVTSKEEFVKRAYFCSALVVACYTVTGIIHDTAQLAHKADAFSPADIHENDTFGWFLGYIAVDKKSIPSDDPLMNGTLWRDLPDQRWWVQPG